MTTFLAVIGAVTLVSCTSSGLLLWVLVRRHNRIRARQVQSLLAHMSRHPAGRNLRPGTTSGGFPFRAYPCGHKLFAPTLDEIEHVHLLHVTQCPIAQKSLPNRKDAA